jgi:poly-gamma-glutamate capsule biosynthesis protein CapA/YwtB (metallophosphatase superfamily)
MAGRVVKPAEPAWYPQPLRVKAARTVRHFETRTASQEAQISLLSKNGYTDGQLVEHNDKLNRYRKELHDRKQPMP